MLLKVAKIAGLLLLVCIVFVIGYFVFMTVTDYKPEAVMTLSTDNNKEQKLTKNTDITATIFNIGYCGLDKDQDFFMDGGTGSRSESKEKTLENLKGVTTFLQEQPSDFILLQEVDQKATRSQKVNQYDHLKNALSEYSATFAINYKVPWVPVPLSKPHGSVESGLATFSRYKIDKANRNQYPGEEKWPRQLALLDRCMIESRISVEDGKELVLINSHLSAYDKGGTIRKQQLGFLKTFIVEEYNKGNYVVVGGDWNHLLPGTNLDTFEATQSWPDWLQPMPEDFSPEGFKWGFDNTVPTSRTVDVRYTEGVNFVSIIDGFLVSPNVTILKVEGHNLGFKYADHQPVILTFQLDR